MDSLTDADRAAIADVLVDYPAALGTPNLLHRALFLAGKRSMSGGTVEATQLGQEASASSGSSAHSGECAAAVPPREPTPTVREAHQRIVSGKGTPEDYRHVLGDPMQGVSFPVAAAAPSRKTDEATALLREWRRIQLAKLAAKVIDGIDRSKTLQRCAQATRQWESQVSAYLAKQPKEAV